MLLAAPLAHDHTAYLPSGPSYPSEETSSGFFDPSSPSRETHPLRHQMHRAFLEGTGISPSWCTCIENFLFLPVILSLILGAVECLYEGIFGRWWNPLITVTNLIRFPGAHYIGRLAVSMVKLLWVVLRGFARVAWKSALMGVTIPGELEGYDLGLGRAAGAEQYQSAG